ncbi:MAG: ABC transporter permease [Endomicrobium sp.]|nr:ABC transporter permease [Endomicrobium sp.]
MSSKLLFQLLEASKNAATMTVETMKGIFGGEISFKDTVAQMVEIGWRSVPIIILSSFFTGMVLVIQAGSATENLFNEPVYVGTITSFSLVMELAPVLTAIVIAGRVGAAITAELGAMKVTEQIDALYTLGANPIKFLAVPRFLACFCMLPILTVISNIIGVYSGMIAATNMWDISPATYWAEALDFMTIKTFLHGFIKSFFFALNIVIIACYQGFNTKGGAEGVGKATTSSVMFSMIAILIMDCFLTTLLIFFGIK